RAGRNTLLFAGPDYAAVVQSGPPTVIAQTSGGQVGRGAWLSDTAVILALSDGGAPGLYAVTLDGARQLLAPLTTVAAPLDVWLP
ncbi:MAG: hypothetical protein KIT52_21030, partial [Anaerolineae bacterium]|nr:hypothetical protein [Anaerolineae bacterium]